MTDQPVNPAETASVWDLLEDVQKETAGGGGIVGQAEIAMVWKSYAKGVAQEDASFYFELGNKESSAAAQALAQALNDEKKCTTKPGCCIQIRVNKDTTLRPNPNPWQGDRFFAYQTWTDAYKKLVMPALKTAVTEAGIVSPKIGKGQTYWVSIGFAPDPFGSTEISQDGVTLVPKQCGYITKVYRTKEEAMAAVGITEAGASAATASAATAASLSGSYPPPCEGYEEAGKYWFEACDTIRITLGAKPTMPKMLAAAKEYSMPIATIKAICGIVA